MGRFLTVLSLLCLAGCSAYQLGGPKPVFHKIEIATVTNSSPRVGTHAVLQQKLIEAFSMDPRLKLGTGDGLLKTEVTQYRREGLTANTTDAYLYSTFRVTYTVRCTLTADNGKKVLFKNRDFTASATLQPVGDATSEEASLAPTLFADIASQIREAATTAW
jgi:Lipopolysaccharide-assembly